MLYERCIVVAALYCATRTLHCAVRPLYFVVTTPYCAVRTLHRAVPTPYCAARTMSCVRCKCVLQIRHCGSEDKSGRPPTRKPTLATRQRDAKRPRDSTIHTAQLGRSHGCKTLALRTSSCRGRRGPATSARFASQRCRYLVRHSTCVRSMAPARVPTRGRPPTARIDTRRPAFSTCAPGWICRRKIA